MTPDLASILSEIEANFDVETRSLSPAAVEEELSYDLASMKERGYDSFLIEQRRPFNSMVARAASHPILGQYLANATPAEIYLASGVRVLTLEAVHQEISEFSPGTILFPMGYLPFATSIGGHAIAFDINRNRVVWADSSYFYSDTISYFDQESSRLVEMPASPENVASIVVSLNDSFWRFFAQLLRGELEEQLDELDGA